MLYSYLQFGIIGNNVKYVVEKGSSPLVFEVLEGIVLYFQ